MVVKAVVVIFLLINSIVDLWKRKICIASIPFMILYGIYYFNRQDTSLFDCMMNLLPGIFLILISIFSQGKIGLGDGIIVITLGLFWNKYQMLFVLMCGFLLAGFWGVLLILLKKATQKTELPFLPFLTIAYILSLLLSIFP